MPAAAGGEGSGTAGRRSPRRRPRSTRWSGTRWAPRRRTRAGSTRSQRQSATPVPWSGSPSLAPNAALHARVSQLAHSRRGTAIPEQNLPGWNLLRADAWLRGSAPGNAVALAVEGAAIDTAPRPGPDAVDQAEQHLDGGCQHDEQQSGAEGAHHEMETAAPQRHLKRGDAEQDVEPAGAGVAADRVAGALAAGDEGDHGDTGDDCDEPGQEHGHAGTSLSNTCS